MNKFNYTNLTPFKWFVLENFPFIEADFDALTEWQLFCKLGKEINKIIDSQNVVGTQMENVTNAFIELQNYVNDYFKNLDVQDEINRKLNEMAVDGSLYAIIKHYTDPIVNQQNNEIMNLSNEFNELETRVNSKANELETRVNSIASGSPAGVFSTYEELTNATTDHSRIYVVSGTGNWYYWNGKAWTSGGSYQSNQLTEGNVKDFQTSFYENVSLYPYNNWIQGKVLNVNNGNESDWPNGSYNPEYIEVDNTKRYIILNGENMIYEAPTFYTYDSEKNFLGVIRPSTNSSRSIDFKNNVSYIRVSFWNVNSPILTVKSKLIKLEDALKLESYNKINSIKNDYFNSINTDDIIIGNKYGFRLLPYQEVSAGNIPTSQYFPNIYEMESENVAVSGGNYIGVVFDYDNLNVGDKIIIDATGSTNMRGITLFATTSTSSDTLSFTRNGNIYTGILTESILTAMNNAKGVNNYYPRLMMIRTGQTAGTVLKTHMKVYINEDFTSFTNYVKNALDIIGQAAEKQTLSALVLGDSITALTGDRSWLTYFNKIQPIQVIQNVAVSGACLMDKEGTIYDGNPVFNGPDNNVNNVLGNQVQKIINNNYDAPDIIMIAIGTNGGINCSLEDIYNSYYDSQGQLIDLQYVDRKTSAGAFRYCNETLRNLYPKATIFWCSPIQGYNGIRNLNNIITYGKNLKALTQAASVQFIDTEKCGITGYTEFNGANGLYLIDGLHPNSNGAKYMGYYNATKVKEYCESAKLLNN